MRTPALSHPYTTLLPYGWSDDRSLQLPPGTGPARIIRHDGATLLAVTPSGPQVLRLPSRLDMAPTVGDWVAIPASPTDVGHPAPEPDTAPVVAVLPRRSLLRRQSADGQAEQTLAANVDLVLVTCGVDRPVKAGRIQRLAAQAWDSGATPVLVLTKVIDLGMVDLPRLELEHPGLRVVACAALEGVGLGELRALLAGRTAVLVGESGAGKSTLANALLGSDVAATWDVRAGDAKGRHTTTARQLHLLPGPGEGTIIDTPGIRSIGLAAEADAVDAVFPDIDQLAGGCRFRDCGHGSEPGCAVQEAVDGGGLAAERLQGWHRLQREVAGAALRATPHEYRAEGRRFGRMAKQELQRKRG
jgi:ribosome biogenesis GTPase